MLVIFLATPAPVASNYPMQLEMFVLCDSFVYTQSPDGRTSWTVNEPFDSVGFPYFPAQISFTIVTALRFDSGNYGEQREHEIAVVLGDADMRPLLDFKNRTRVQNVRKIKLPSINRSHCDIFSWKQGASGSVAGTGGVWVDRPGDYFFFLNVDGQNLARLPLHIVQH